MKVPLRWLKEYVDVEITPERLARLMTFAGLEVEAMDYVGVPLPEEGAAAEAKIQGLAWDPAHIVVASIQEVMSHPDADRLVLARLDDGLAVHTIVTGAPNLQPMKDQGPLDEPLKVVCAREGSTIYDGHKPGRHPTKLKKTKIRGVESYMMACSEKELGISDEHEGIIVLDADAPDPGTPLVDYIGDVVFDISLTPNVSRAACMVGVAREVAALTGGTLREPKYDVDTGEGDLGELVHVDIREPGLNPRFTASLLDGVKVGPSPYWMQLRLRLAGMRPINNIVDVSNYVMLETGQPLHAFDFDVLRDRAGRSGAEVVTIITRLAESGERITTLDGEDRRLSDSTIMVADTEGVLSIGGVMGGGESEVSDGTTRVLIEAAAWEMINIRQTVGEQKLQSSEAGYRFSRGVHPARAIIGNRGALDWMRRLSPGSLAKGLLDVYPAPPPTQTIEFPLTEITRLLGIEIPVGETRRILEALEFEVEDAGGGVLRVTVPDHRVDIETGVADLVEEVARIYGYERIPETQIADEMPAQIGNVDLDDEERVRDVLVKLGLQEVVTYRMTTPEREALVSPGDAPASPHVELANPITSDRTVLRRLLLPSVLEVVESNFRFRDEQALFEIGKVFRPRDGQELPGEPRELVIVMAGRRGPEDWTGQ
ncbi:MAG: phenylalanine--tRNA ligase subunit beta, partial [Gemmatimonadota bacterium]|nr:phenylalanine--tRNA ligase subunit beta [Gemmatimonadota bacterium]